MPALPKVLAALTDEEELVGGSFMNALADDDVVWSVFKKDDEGGTIIFDVSWMGIELGRFVVDSEGTAPWE